MKKVKYETNAARLRRGGLRPKRVLFITVVSMFLGETIIMLVLPLLPPMNLSMHALFDATLLTMLLFPILFLKIYRPMSAEVAELANEIAQLKTLEGVVPICMHCHKMRDDQDVWQELEIYLQSHTQAEFSHSLCPECHDEHYSDEFS